MLINNEDAKTQSSTMHKDAASARVTNSRALRHRDSIARRRSPKPLLTTIAVLSSAALLYGCAAAPAETTTPDAADGAESTFLPCMVADVGGFNDKSFNESAYEGIKETATKLGLKFIAVESPTETDYEANVNSLVSQDCNLIITVGYLLADATVTAAKANPDVHFAIIDDKADLDFDGTTDAANIKPILFDVAQAAFLGGYAAASYTKTGIVGTFAGMNIPPVTIFLDGYADGVAYYNQQKGTSVKVLGWDLAVHDGLAIGSFTAGTQALTAAQGLIDQGADVIQSGGGTTYLSIIAAFKDSGVEGVVLGGDSDMFFVEPQHAKSWLASVLKGTKSSVASVIEQAATGVFDTSPYIGVLANGGVSLSPFHDLESKVSPTLQKELEAISAGIVDGSIVVTSPSSPK